MSERLALDQLAACLRGGLPDAPDWMAILGLANRALVSPQLCSEMTRSGAIDQVPEEVRKFLTVVSARNRERNKRLSEQLRDALQALNGAGIEPVLLKGAAVWATAGSGDQCDRVLRDLDLMVNPSEAKHAMEVIEAAGMPCLVKYPEDLERMHVVAEFGRPADVGALDLHCRPPGPIGFAQLLDLDAHCARISWSGAQAKVPAPALQMFFLILHDQFHDGEYWRGGIDLRHLLDIRQLSAACRPDDWSLLERLCRTRLVRNALAAQLIAAERLVGAPVAESLARRRWARIQYRRHLWQFAHRRIALPLGFLAMLVEAPNLFAYWSVSERQARAHNAARQGTLLRLARRAKRLTSILSSRG